MADEAKWERYAAGAGIAFVVLVLVSALLPGVPPATDDPVPDIRAYYADHRTALLLATYLGGLTLIVSLWFFAALRSVLHRAEGGEGTISNLMFGAAIATNVVALLSAIPATVLAFNIDRDDATVRLFFDLSNMFFPLVMFPWALTTVAAAVIMVRTGVFPRWLGWAGLVAAAVMLVSAAGLGQTSGALAAGGPFAFVALILGLAWLLVTSIIMLTRHIAQPITRAQPA